MDALLEGLLASTLKDPATLSAIKSAISLILLVSGVHFLSSLSKYHVPLDAELAHRMHTNP